MFNTSKIAPAVANALGISEEAYMRYVDDNLQSLDFMTDDMADQAEVDASIQDFIQDARNNLSVINGYGL